VARTRPTTGYHVDVDNDRSILHVDMDAFFASLAQLDDPALRGKAVLTGGAGRRGVVTAASYEARRYGCRSAMPMAVARRLCPHAVVAHVSGQRIAEASEQVFALLSAVSPLVQPVSVDEAFVDVTGTEALHGDVVALARTIKRRIRQRVGLTASIGVSFNKFLAKLASDMDKPDGLTSIMAEDLDRVLPPLAIERIHGVGPATAKRLTKAGIHTIGDLRQMGAEQLRRRFGEAGAHFHRLAWGLDDRPVVADHQAKSIGQEQTFGENVAERDILHATLLQHAAHVARRLRRHQRRARGVSVKIRFGDFETITRSATLERSTDLTDELYAAARDLFERWSARHFQPVRLIGLAAERLTADGEQLALFGEARRSDRRRLEQTLDQIQAKYGTGSVYRASTGPTGPANRGRDGRRG
jgi:DNA polymerase-4